MRVRFPLFARVLLYFFVNLLVIAVALVTMVDHTFQAGPESPLAGLAGNRLGEVAFAVREELEHTPREGWDAVLSRHAARFDAELMLVSADGFHLAGARLDLPPEVAGRLRREPMPVAFRDGPPPGPEAVPAPVPGAPPAATGTPGAGSGPPREPGGVFHGPRPGRFPAFTVRAGDPVRYWGGTPLRLLVEPDRRPLHAVLLASSSSFTGGGLFMDLTPWLLVVSALVVLSILLWFPVVRSITRPLGEMSRTASLIAQGRFDRRLAVRRRDEIGALATSINDMSGRLDRLVNGQKRFLRDVAHELASPIARVQLELGILEHALAADGASRLEDLREEVQQLADLVAELLSFSRAENSPGRVAPEPTRVADVIAKAVRRENRSGCDVRTAVEPDLEALADPELLTRALANILRNAIRYAGMSGPIEIHARRDGAQVRIEVRDAGPGVPPEHLGRVFEPFHRVEPARDRESGGAGLGLAIVRTCILACNGSVEAANVEPHGFAVTITLPAVEG